MRAIRTASGGVAAGALLFILGVTVLAGGQGSVSSAPAGAGLAVSCGPAGPLGGLSIDQAANAEVIVAVADALGVGPRGAQVALMTALTESGLHNEPPGVGGGGSVGLFQQIASQGWGTIAQEADPAEAAAMFVTAMMAIPGWAQLPPWQVAQMVQHSGAGAASAGTANYEPSWAPAGAVLASIDPSGTGAECGVSAPGAVPADPTGPFGLPPGFTIPAAATPAETVVVSYALAQLGKGYAWGAAGPDLFDCSGLTMMAWAQAGVGLDHYTGSQLHEGTAVARYADISPGDLVLVPGADGTLAAPGHVGLYIGDGLVESAVDPEQGIIVQSWANFTAGGLSGIRHPS